MSSTPAISVKHVARAGYDLVVVGGDLDLYTQPHLREVVFDPAVCARPVLSIDLSGLDFMDSSGISFIVATRRWLLARDAELVLICPEGHIRKVLRTSGLDRVLRVVASEAAVAGDGRATVA